MTEEKIKKDFVGKERAGCPFRQGHYCNDKCGLYVEGIKSCVFFSITSNLGSIKQMLEKIIGNKEEK